MIELQRHPMPPAKREEGAFTKGKIGCFAKPFPECQGELKTGWKNSADQRWKTTSTNERHWGKLSRIEVKYCPSGLHKGGGRSKDWAIARENKKGRGGEKEETGRRKILLQLSHHVSICCETAFSRARKEVVLLGMASGR